MQPTGGLRVAAGRTAHTTHTYYVELMPFDESRKGEGAGRGWGLLHLRGRERFPCASNSVVASCRDTNWRCPRQHQLQLASEVRIVAGEEIAALRDVFRRHVMEKPVCVRSDPDTGMGRARASRGKVERDSESTNKVIR